MASLAPTAALLSRHGIQLGLCCVTQQLLDLDPPPDEPNVLLPSGELVLCSTYPRIESHRACPDAKAYREEMRRIKSEKVI